MTAAVTPNITVFAHERFPKDIAGQSEWAIERLLSEYADTGRDWLLKIARSYRPDLTDEQFTEAVEELYVLAAEVSEATVTGEAKRLDLALDAYAAALHELASKPDDTMAVADALREPVTLRSVT